MNFQTSALPVQDWSHCHTYRASGVLPNIQVLEISFMYFSDCRPCVRPAGLAADVLCVECTAGVGRAFTRVAGWQRYRVIAEGRSARSHGNMASAYRGWLTVAGGVLIHLTLGTLYTFGEWKNCLHCFAINLRALFNEFVGEVFVFRSWSGRMLQPSTVTTNLYYTRPSVAAL